MVAVQVYVEMRAHHPGRNMQLSHSLIRASLTICIHSILRTDARLSRSSDAVNLVNIDAVYNRADPLEEKGFLVIFADHCVAKHLREVGRAIPDVFLGLYLLLV